MNPIKYFKKIKINFLMLINPPLNAWYNGIIPAGLPRTNNPIETLNAVIKHEILKSFRNIF